MDTSRIAAFSVFADLPATELDELAGAMTEVEVEAGSNVLTLDDYGTAIYFIERGEAAVLTDGGAKALGPGDTFGEIALLLTGQRTATVAARTHMRLISLSGQDFERIRVYPSSSTRCAVSGSSARVSKSRGADQGAIKTLSASRSFIAL